MTNKGINVIIAHNQSNLNQFPSSDNLVFDERGIMWIQTDNGAEEVTEETNDQMLLVAPSALVDDDGEPVIANSDNHWGLSFNLNTKY